MNRRAYVATIAGLAVTPGCTTQASNPDSEHTDTDTHSGEKSISTLNVSDGDKNCPSFIEGADRTVCYSDREDADVYLEPSAERFVEYEASDTVQTLRLRLHNDSSEAFALNVNDWAIKRRTEDGWRQVAPETPH